MPPIVCLAFGALAGAAALHRQSALPVPALCWSAAVLAVCALLWASASGRRARHPLLHSLFIVVAAASVSFAYAATRSAVRLADRLDLVLEGRDIDIVGVVDALPTRTDHGTAFRFRVDAAPNGVPRLLQLTWYRSREGDTPAWPVAPGERWQFGVRLKQVHGRQNPHLPDAEAYLLGQGIGATGYVRPGHPPRRLAPCCDTPGDRIESARMALRERMLRATAGYASAGVLVALALGDQQQVPWAQWQDFARTGTTHLVSISGLHVVIWAVVFGGLSGGLWRRWPRAALRMPAQQAGALAGLCAAAGYCALAGWGVPAQRSLLMLAVLAATRLGARRVGAASALALALLAVLALDPWAVGGRGFWLSFVAVALLLWASDRGGRAWQRWVSAQWAVTLGLMPVLLAMTGQVSLISPLANALAIPLVTVGLLPMVFVGLAWPGDAVLQGAAVCGDALLRGAASLAEPGWAVWQQAVPPLPVVITGLLGATACLLPRGVPGRVAGLLLLVPLLLWRPARPHAGEFELTVLDVGQGLAVHVRTASHDMLFDAGPRFGALSDAGQRIVVPYLRGSGVTALDVLVVSHADADHAGGAESVLAALPVRRLMAAVPDTHPLSLRAGHTRCRRGTRWTWDAVHFEVLHPHPAADITGHGNETSCVLRVSAAGGSALLTADIDTQREAELLAAGLLAPASVVVAAHHGSRTASSAAFVAAVRPALAVFPVGYRSRFGHPHPEVVKRWADSGAATLRTDTGGAIQVSVTAGAVRWQRWREQARRYWHATEVAEAR